MSNHNTILQSILKFIKLTNNMISEQELNLARFLNTKLANGYLITRIIFFVLRLVIVAMIFKLAIWLFYIVFAIYLFQVTFQQDTNKTDD